MYSGEEIYVACVFASSDQFVQVLLAGTKRYRIQDIFNIKYKAIIV